MQNRKQTLTAKFHLLKAIRQFFEEQGFMDVMTPPVVENPGMETHIHPFKVEHTYKNQNFGMYLHTSPEFAMKELLGLGFEKIFNLSYCFRDEPKASNHRFQFIMLEWYRTQAYYEAIMDDTEKLFKYSFEYLNNQAIKTDPRFHNISFQRATISEIFKEILNIEILNYLDINELKQLIEKNFKDVPLPVMGEELSFDDYFFLLFLNKIEPELKNYPFLLLKEFPYQLAALSTIKKDNPKVCERFEVYCHGIELCNAFNELTDIHIQKKRFELQSDEKMDLYHYRLPSPTQFYNVLEQGLPKSSGIALGVERLLKILTNNQNPFWN